MADSVEKPKRGGKGSWPSGPTRSKPKGKGGKGKSPNFRHPKGVAYCTDHHLHNKCSGSCGRSHNCHGPRGFLVSVGITGHQCESAHSGGEPTPPEPQRKADRAGEARTASGGRGLLQGATGPGSPSTEEEPPRQWEEPAERPRNEDPPGKGRSQGGKNRQGKQQAQGQMTGGSDKGHTESLGGASPTFGKAVPHPAVRWEG